MDLNLDQILCLEMDAEIQENADTDDFSYLDYVMGDDLDDPKYDTEDDDDDDIDIIENRRC